MGRILVVTKDRYVFPAIFDHATDGISIFLLSMLEGRDEVKNR